MQRPGQPQNYSQRVLHRVASSPELEVHPLLSHQGLFVAMCCDVSLHSQATRPTWCSRSWTCPWPLVWPAPTQPWWALRPRRSATSRCRCDPKLLRPCCACSRVETALQRYEQMQVRALRPNLCDVSAPSYRWIMSLLRC